MKQMLKKAIERQIAGHFSFVEILSFCPINWKTNARESIEMVELMEKTFKVGVINE
jgi:2-oxoglutarate ferredoxin oxidoreductase subunit beta